MFRAAVTKLPCDVEHVTFVAACWPPWFICITCCNILVPHWAACYAQANVGGNNSLQTPACRRLQISSWDDDEANFTSTENAASQRTTLFSGKRKWICKKKRVRRDPTRHSVNWTCTVHFVTDPRPITEDHVMPEHLCLIWITSMTPVADGHRMLPPHIACSHPSTSK